MDDNTESLEAYERTHRLVEALIRGERPEEWSNPSELEAHILRVAGELNSLGAAPRPSPGFAQALAGELEALSEPGPKRMWRRLTRRGLLRGVASVAGLLVAGAAADRLVGRIGAADAGPGWVAVARTTELLPGSALRFLAAGREGYLVNLDGAARAVSAICTHLPCIVQWNGAGRDFICPCHEAEFGADGQHRPTPSYDRQLPPLPSFPVKQVGAMIYVFPGESSSPGSAAPPTEDEEYRQR
jgi:nitrite reductase/ring-hydroxylating ferredoxin subunit